LPKLTKRFVDALRPVARDTQQVAGMIPRVFTNTSAQIHSRLAQGGSLQTLRIKTHGWIDRRGKDE